MEPGGAGVDVVEHPIVQNGGQVGGVDVDFDTGIPLGSEPTGGPVVAVIVINGLSYSVLEKVNKTTLHHPQGSTSRTSSIQHCLRDLATTARHFRTRWLPRRGRFQIVSNSQCKLFSGRRRDKK